jgi:type I restriction enzyme R subunit
VDAPTCQNVVLVRVIGSMTEFKQIIGRGTRVREDKGKLFFNILDYMTVSQVRRQFYPLSSKDLRQRRPGQDWRRTCDTVIYTGSATRLFADPEFDGEPALATVEEINERGETIEDSRTIEQEQEATEEEEARQPQYDDEEHLPRKYYVHGGKAEIDTEVTYDLNADGSKLRTVQVTQYAADTVRTLYTDPDDLRRRWADFEQRSAVVEMLEERGIDFNELAATAGRPDADPFDLLCHLAYNSPLRTRKERAEQLRKQRKDFFDQYSPEARAILNDLLEKYAEHGTGQFAIPDVLEVPPISRHGNVMEIAEKFGGSEQLVDAVHRLQALLYAA